MNARMTIGALALVALAACGGSNETEATVTETAAAAAAGAEPAPAAAEAAAAPAKGDAPTKAFMVGKWAEEGECDLAIDFKADGTMVGPFDSWELKGNVLTMPPNPQAITLTVVDDKTLESRNGDRPPAKLVRCP